MNQRQKAIEIFLSGVEGVKPKILIEPYILIKQDSLHIKDLVYDLSILKNIYVVGFGKASAAMAQAMETSLGSKITDGHIITKYGHSVPLNFIKISEAGHPVPDENGLKGTADIVSILDKAEKNDLVICLISGGGSALLADVPEGCSLDDVIKVNSILLKVGASITEMNCIRKHLSAVKGGHLSKAAYPARVVSLILSDVVGDPLDVIASGPTVADPTTFSDALSIIAKYKIEDAIPEQIISYLKNGEGNIEQETLKESDVILKSTNNLIIGTNLLALGAAKKKAIALGYKTQIITSKIDGDINVVAAYIIRVIQENVSNKQTCLLFAGEPTINVKGKGLGGRSQHLALIIAKYLNNMPGITFLSAGTDGSDGPTDAAGAVVDASTHINATNLHLDINQYISNFDSYNFFRREGGQIFTGSTKTNVMDLMIAIIE